ncbi:MAG: CD225/dispanin family protein [Coriobacteriia bacterium]|nr:CD225/dispanin family protein [Coriobacteriia bacterium]MCL2750347.1 CD225/dispanin family protein [Coriobacteriia bacterium]
MTEQQYLPPKPTDKLVTPISLDQVYPTPPPEQEAVTSGQTYPEPYQQAYPNQQPYQQPNLYQQPYQQQSPYAQPNQQPYQQQSLYAQPNQQPYQQQSPYAQPNQQPYQQQSPYAQPNQQPYQKQSPYAQPNQQPYQQQSPYALPNQQQSPYGQPSYPIPVQPVNPSLPGGQAPQNQQQSFYQPQPYHQPQQQWQQPYQQHGQQITNQFGLYLTLSILAFLLLTWPFAIPAIVNAVRMNTAFKKGDRDTYLSAKKQCRIWLIVSLVVGVILITFLFAATLV